MNRSAAQPDLFDLFGAPPEPPRAAPERAPQLSMAAVHWLVVSTTRARTACGIAIIDYRFKVRFGISVEDDLEVLCTHDAFDGTVSCARCLEVRG